MKVRYSYLAQQFENPEPIFEEIRKLLKTGEFTLGPQVAEFERQFAHLIGTRYAIGVGSGTDAIKLALKSHGVGAGDEVITAANTFIATAGAINEIGARPVFVDCNESYVIDVEKVEAAITEKTKAIVPVHFTGEPCDMTRLKKIAEERGLVLVEDACQAILARHRGFNCGTFGVAGAFSLHPLKNLNVWSDGGMIVTDDHETYERLKLLRNHGLKNRDEISCFGYNSRLDTIQAIVGNWLIGQAEAITFRRQRNAAYYDSNLRGLEGVTLPPRPGRVESAFNKSCFHLYMFEVHPSVRNDLLNFLVAAGIEAKVHYPIPLYQQEGLKHLGYNPGDFPTADRQAKSVISLPVDQHLELKEQDYCIEKVREFFKSRARSW